MARYRFNSRTVLVDERQRRVGGPLRQDRLRLIADRQIEVERRILRVRRPGGRRRQLRAESERQLRRVRRCLDRGQRLVVGGVRRRSAAAAAAAARRQAARAHDVQAAEHVSVLHADPRGAVAAHRVTDKAAALAARDRSIVRVDVRHDVARDVILEVSRRHRAGVHRAVVHRLRVGQHDDHLVRAFGEGPLDRLRHVDFLAPLLRADRVAMQGVDDRIPARAVLVVARGQEDDRVAIDGVSFQVALERLAVNLDALDDGWTRARDRVRHVRLHLRNSGENADRCYGNCRRQSGHASI